MAANADALLSFVFVTTIVSPVIERYPLHTVQIPGTLLFTAANRAAEQAAETIGKTGSKQP
jgi:hypothetical protein